MRKYETHREGYRTDVDYFIDNVGDEIGQTIKVLMKRLYDSEIDIDEFDEKIKSRVGSSIAVLSSIDQ